MRDSQYHAPASRVHALVGRPDWPPIETELDRRGVRLKRVGRELIGPCPVCGGVDRFGVSIAKQVWNCRGCAQGGDVVDLVQHIDSVGFSAAVETLTGEKPRRAPVVKSTPKISNNDDYERRQHDKAAWLWRQRQPLVGSIAETYLRESRCYPGPLPPSLGFLPARTSAHHPAMIAAFGLCDEPETGMITAPSDVIAVHLTLLKPDGSDKAEVEKPKLVVGGPGGQPITIAPPNDLLGLAICEGVEDALTAHVGTGLGAWAAGSAPHMAKLGDAVPDYIEAVTIWSHPDPAGQNGARELAELLGLRGVEVRIEGLLARSLTDRDMIALVGGNR